MDGYVTVYMSADALIAYQNGIEVWGNARYKENSNTMIEVHVPIGDVTEVLSPRVTCNSEIRVHRK